jgi:hypothetical protein
MADFATARYSDDDDDQMQQSNGMPTPPGMRMRSILPSFYGSLPSKSTRPNFRPVQNPFYEVSEVRHKSLRKERLTPDGNGVVNGYVKFKVITNQSMRRVIKLPKGYSFPPNQGLGPETYSFGSPPLPIPHSGPFVLGSRFTPPYLPNDFGRLLKMDETDKKLFKFCKPSTMIQARIRLTLVQTWLQSALGELSFPKPTVGEKLLLPSLNLITVSTMRFSP